MKPCLAGCPQPSSRQIADPLALLLDDVEPTKPFRFVRSRSTVRASPAQSRRTLPSSPPRFQRGGDRSFQVGGELCMSGRRVSRRDWPRACGPPPRAACRRRRRRAARHPRPALPSPRRSRCRDRSKRRHRVLRPVDILLESRAHFAMIAERIHRRGRNGVDRVGSDQLLDIEYVAVVFVLRSGACPKQPLHPRALGPQLLPTRAGEKPLVALIGKLGIGDRDLAAEPASAWRCSASFGLPSALLR